MSSFEKNKWAAILEHLLSKHRLEYPEDQRDDNELFNSVMEHLIEIGLAREKADKVILPEIAQDA